MDSSALRDKLHHYIDVADEQKLQAIYVLLENEIDWSYTSKDIALLHHRRQQHLQGLSKSFTIEESLEAIRPITD
ncbi:hypothetical protein [Flavihumibacter sp.]|uniref:hypothetical protein n=1 Tax=Flavihumibacter sp. TaxID=1913981 RepID=UPI002FCB3C22